MCLFLMPVAFVILLPFALLSIGPTVDHHPHSPPMTHRTTPRKEFAMMTVNTTATPNDPPTADSCAICFFGLPRSFRLLVLPSIIQNILIPNRKNGCDFYLHYFHSDSEDRGRSGGGGVLDTEQVWLLHDAIAEVYGGDGGGGNTSNIHSRRSRSSGGVHLSIIRDTNDTFWKERGRQIGRYKTARALDGKLLYYPWMAKSYDMNSVYNIIKQWHSISSVWQEMERTAPRLGKRYTRVAMLRNDAVYVTPFDIYQISSTTRDDRNEIVAVPNWARFPINDRMVYGPHDAVRIWATERFDRLETHVRTYEPGYGLHSERFLNHSIFPAIRERGYPVVANPEICFFRARADGSAWINDCVTRDGAALGFRAADTQAMVEALVGHPCVRSKFNKKTVQLHCNVDVANASKPEGGI